MSRDINSVVVIGGGTMGTGIAGLCAQTDHPVLLLEINDEAKEKAKDRILNGRPPAVDDPDKVKNITFGTIDDDLSAIADYDWICEAIVEDLPTKRTIFEKLEPLRKEGSVISSNTSGILLREITEGMPERLRQDIAVTHFFNPVKIMRLIELIPGSETNPEVINTLAAFVGGKLGKGVVYAKDTVNFIGNRIGCFWMMSGLHYAQDSLSAGISMEQVDALMSQPVGLPPTGLYGLIDLIGLDVMDLVGKNLATNLTADDKGMEYVTLPGPIQAMLERGQIGRKSGAGFYRMHKLDDGSRRTEIFDLINNEWRDSEKFKLSDMHSTLEVIMTDDPAGNFAWQIMSNTLCYAADLVPEISNDVVNVDRAMRWGYAWNRGPFEIIDCLGADRFIARLSQTNTQIPKMLKVLMESGNNSFYVSNGQEYLGQDGKYHATPPE